MIAAGELLVDARGLRCPWPVLRLARAVRDQPPGSRIRLLADDPAAPAEVAALAEERGWRIEGGDIANSGMIILAP